MRHLKLMVGVGVLAVAATAQAQWSDDFNRPDSSDMGPDWIEEVGDFRIAESHGRAGSGMGNQWMRHTSAALEYDEAVMSVDIFATDPALSYVALMSGLPSGGATDNLFIKIQGSGMFTNAGFYGRFNSNYWGGGFITLDTPFEAARMTVSIIDNGDTVKLDLDTDFNGEVDQTYSASGVLAINGNFGTEFGIGAYGNADFDNWVVTPEPASIMLLGLPALLALRRRR